MESIGQWAASKQPAGECEDDEISVRRVRLGWVLPLAVVVTDMVSTVLSLQGA